jgi:zinc protease
MRRMLPIVTVLLILLSPVLVLGGPKKVELPTYRAHTLENGLKVFIMEAREVPLVTVRLLIPVGSAQDDRDREGIANLTATLTMKGAGGMTADEIAETIDGVGGRLNAYADRDMTLVTGSFMARDLSRALDMMSTVVMKPDFAPEEVEREKGIITAELQSYKEEPYWLATIAFVNALVGDHPYAHHIEGTIESIAEIKRDDIVTFHKEHYVPSGSILTIVGDVNAKKALKDVKNKFVRWKGAAKSRKIEPLEMKAFPGTKVVVIDKPDATQSQIRIGNIAVGRNTPDYFPLLVANTILGGGFTSRLVDEIRVNRGLTYGVRSRLNQLRHGGMFGVYTFTKNETLRETIDVALAEVGKIRTEEVGEEELTKSKRYLSGLFPFDLETNADLARWLTELAFYGLPDDFVENYRDEVGKVSSADVRRCAEKYFHTDDCFILILTNYEEVKDQLEGLGTVEVIGIDDVY